MSLHEDQSPVTILISYLPSLPLTGLLEPYWLPLHCSSDMLPSLGFKLALAFFFEAESTKKKFQFGYSCPFSPQVLIQMLPENFSEAPPYNLFRIAPLSPAIPNLPSLPFLCSTYHHLTYYIFCLLAHLSSMKGMLSILC